MVHTAIRSDVISGTGATPNSLFYDSIRSQYDPVHFSGTVVWRTRQHRLVQLGSAYPLDRRREGNEREK